MIEFDVWSLLTIHIVVLSLAMGIIVLVCIIIILFLILELLELRLRLVIRIVVHRMQIMSTHLLHVVGVVVIELVSMTHCHIFEHLLLSDWDMSTHGTRPILIYWLHLGGT